MSMEDFEKYLRGRSQSIQHIGHVEPFDRYMKTQRKKTGIEEYSHKDVESFIQWELSDGNVPRLGSLFVYFIFRKDLEAKKLVKTLSKKYKQQIDSQEKERKSRPWWIDNLSSALDSRVGEEIRREMLEGREGLKQSSSSKKKIKYAKKVIEKLEQSIDTEVRRELLSCGIHKRSPGGLERIRKQFKRVKDLDKFLEILQAESREKWGTKSELLLQWITDNPECEGGVRKGDVIYVCKVPHQATEFLTTDDDEMKKYHYCHCGWAKESLRTKDVDISPEFCYCGAGWYRQFWEAVFQEPVKVEVVETVMNGDSRCMFAVHIPPNHIPK